MRIAAQSTIGASEQAILALSHSAGDETLVLPTNLRHLAGGAEAALTQAIITWAQQSNDRKVETFAASDEQVAEFVRRLPGLVAGLCANGAIGRGSGVSVFPVLRTAALERLGQLQSSRPKFAYRGSSAEIVCADHLGRDSPYLLYSPDQRGGARLRPRENFRDLARWLLRNTIPRGYRAQFDPEAADAIGGMLFEIFKNTQEHARVDSRGDLLAISIRAIKTNHHGITPNDLSRISEDFAPLAKYCRTLAAPDGAAQVHFFELSVVDSGPGFASTWTGQPLDELSLGEEEHAVRECFGRGSAKGQSRFGEGLPHVLRLLSRQQGFLRLRTGRMSLYVDCSNQAAGEDPASIRRFDPSDSPHLGRVAGSLLTVLIPMRR